MPTTRKTSIAKKAAAKPRAKKSDEGALMDFEDFVSQNPRPRANSNRGLIFSTLLVVIVILAAVSIFSFRNTETVVQEKTLKFKAISLDNDLVYYAKVVKEDSMNIYLDEVYYIQMQQQTIPATEEGAEPEVINVPVLIKRGQELHKPEGYLQINRDKLMAVEEVGADSEILVEINRINGIQ
jgi:hypothetical protein